MQSPNHFPAPRTINEGADKPGNQKNEICQPKIFFFSVARLFVFVFVPGGHSTMASRNQNLSAEHPLKVFVSSRTPHI